MAFSYTAATVKYYGCRGYMYWWSFVNDIFSCLHLMGIIIDDF
jgi:hypothetical protein